MIETEQITYLQVDDIEKADLDELKDKPESEQKPPEIKYRGEYWPAAEAPGTKQLARSQGASRRDTQQISSSITRNDQEQPQQGGNHSVHGFVKRAESSDGEICAYGEDCYPYPYPLKDMFDWYSKVTWQSQEGDK